MLKTPKPASLEQVRCFLKGTQSFDLELSGREGVYHINMVDEVTQYQVVSDSEAAVVLILGEGQDQSISRRAILLNTR